MKLLYIGCYPYKSGWGEASRGDVDAMIKNGINVALRPVNYAVPRYPHEYQIFENKSIKGVTNVLQYCLPSEWRRYGDMKHVGYIEIESQNIVNSIFVDYFNMVDEIWVPNLDGAQAVRNVTDIPVKCVPHAVNLDIYKKDYKIQEIEEISGTYKFLCVSENIPRKNLDQLIEEFWLAFDPTEPVSLILKTNDSINENIKYLKQKLRLYDVDAYQKIIVITEKLTDEEMLGLYQYADCYVNPSMGESWCLPIIHAAGFNKPIITNFSGGPADTLSNYKNVRTTVNVLEGCVGNNNISGYQDYRDFWKKPLYQEIMTNMINQYKNRDDNKMCHGSLDKFSEEVFANNVKLAMN